MRKEFKRIEVCSGAGRREFGTWTWVEDWAALCGKASEIPKWIGKPGEPVPTASAQNMWLSVCVNVDQKGLCQRLW